MLEFESLFGPPIEFPSKFHAFGYFFKEDWRTERPDEWMPAEKDGTRVMDWASFIRDRIREDDMTRDEAWQSILPLEE